MGILEGDLKGLVTGEQLQQVEEQMGELEEWAGKQLQQVNARLDAEVEGLLSYMEFETWGARSVGGGGVEGASDGPA